MAYAIMRCKKLASAGSVASSLRHCYRERETANADAARTPQNEHGAASSTDEAMGKLRAMLPAKRLPKTAAGRFSRLPNRAVSRVTHIIATQQAKEALPLPRIFTPVNRSTDSWPIDEAEFDIPPQFR